MRKGSMIEHKHGHLSKGMRKMGRRNLEDGGDNARRAWCMMRRGEMEERKVKRLGEVKGEK